MRMLRPDHWKQNLMDTRNMHAYISSCSVKLKNKYYVVLVIEYAYYK